MMIIIIIKLNRRFLRVGVTDAPGLSHGQWGTAPRLLQHGKLMLCLKNPSLNLAKPSPKVSMRAKKGGGSPWECHRLCEEELLVGMFWEVMLWAVPPF